MEREKKSRVEFDLVAEKVGLLAEELLSDRW